MDYYENAISEVTKDISQDSIGNISCTYQQGIRRTLNCTLSKDYSPNKDNCLYIGEKIRVSIGLANTTNIWWFNYGVFLTKTADRNDDGSYTISAVDKFGIFTGDLNQGTLQVTNKIPAGSSIGVLIEDSITADDGSGKLLDSIPPKISMDLYNKLLPYDIEKDAKGHLSDILTDAVTAYDCDIFYNKMGELCATKQNFDTYNQLAPSWIFKKNDSTLYSHTESYDYTSVVNTITVSSDTSSKVLYQYTAINDYPMSPFCVSKIGTRIDGDNSIIESSMIISDKSAEDYANYKLKKKLRQSFSVNLECGYLPHLDVDDVIICEDIDDSSLIINEITILLGNGNMSIVATNLDYLKTTENSSNYVEQTDNYIRNEADWTYMDVGVNALSAYSGSDTIIEMPNTINGTTIVSVGIPTNSAISFASYGFIKVKVGEGITTLGAGIFSGSTTLTKIIIPNTVTFIGSGCFNGCNNLADVKLEENLITINPYAFYGIGVTLAIIPSTVETIGTYAFNSCDNLATVTINGCTTMGEYAFANMDSLKSVTIGSNCTTIGTNAFYSSGVTNLTFSSGCKTIGNNAFLGCNLSSVTIPSTCTSIGDYAFGSNSNLITANVPTGCTLGTGAFPDTCTINYY